MKNMLKSAAAIVTFVTIGTAASAATFQQPQCKEGETGCVKTVFIPQAPDTSPTVSYSALCETVGGFGLLAFSDNTALLNRIRAGLAAGQTVMADVEGTQLTRVSASGEVHVIAVVDGPGGRSVVCYQSY